MASWGKDCSMHGVSSQLCPVRLQKHCPTALHRPAWLGQGGAGVCRQGSGTPFHGRGEEGVLEGTGGS